MALVCLLMAIAVLSPTAAEAQGCAMCRTVGGGADDPLTKGMFRSVLFLLSVPMLLVLGIGGWLFYNLRQPQTDDPTDPTEALAARVVEFRRN